MPKTVRPIRSVGIAEIRRARLPVETAAVRTPLVPLHVEEAPAEIHLKLENLQPIGSFKIRGAANAMAAIDSDELAAGVYTASAGNMAQGIAWNARRLGIPCHVVMPDNAPDTKVEAVERLGATIVPLPWSEWWSVLVEHHHDGVPGRFIHPVSDPDVIAGNGTCGLEILEDLPQVETVVVPYGGGGLSCGIASAIKAIKPDVQVFAAEFDGAAPLSAALEHGGPVAIDRRPSFIDGIGGGSVLDEMWPLASSILDGALVVSEEAVVEAIRTMIACNRVVAEGAGGAAVAAALAGAAGSGTVVCVVSGGNLSSAALRAVLEGRIPDPD